MQPSAVLFGYGVDCSECELQGHSGELRAEMFSKSHTVSRLLRIERHECLATRGHCRKFATGAEATSSPCPSTDIPTRHLL